MEYWIVKGNTAQNGDFGLIQAGSFGQWRTKLPPKNWKFGDRIFFWASSPRSELIALGEFKGLTGEYTEDGQSFYSLKYLTNVIDSPLKQAALRADRLLDNAIFLKVGPAASVQRLTVSEGEHLYRLLIAKNPKHRGIWPELEDQEVTMLDVDFSAIEGEARMKVHLKRERNRVLIEAKRTSVTSVKGKLACEVCGFDFHARYGELGNGFCEVHHKKPLASAAGPTETRLEDLAIVCSNCHRMIHRSKCALSIGQLKMQLRKELN